MTLQTCRAERQDATAKIYSESRARAKVRHALLHYRSFDSCTVGLKPGAYIRDMLVLNDTSSRYLPKTLLKV